MDNKKSNLNPEPVPGPADLKTPNAKPLPKAPPVHESEASAESAKPSGQWPGAFAAVGQIYDQLKKNPQPAIVITVVYALLTTVALFTLEADAGSYTDSRQSAYDGFIYLLFALAMPIYSLALADKKSISIAEFYKMDAGRYISVLVATFLLLVIFFLSALPLLIPLIWTVAWFSMTTYIVADKKLSPVDAIKESKRLAQNDKGKVWGVVGVSILLSIGAALLAAIPVIGGIAQAVTTILGSGAMALLYRWLQAHSSAPAE